MTVLAIVEEEGDALFSTDSTKGDSGSPSVNSSEGNRMGSQVKDPPLVNSVCIILKEVIQTHSKMFCLDPKICYDIEALFDSKVFSKYFENTTVFEITTVLFTMSCLVAPNNCAFNIVVLGKLQFFLCIKKRTQHLFFLN